MTQWKQVLKDLENNSNYHRASCARRLFSENIFRKSKSKFTRFKGINFQKSCKNSCSCFEKCNRKPSQSHKNACQQHFTAQRSGKAVLHRTIKTFGQQGWRNGSNF